MIVWAGVMTIAVAVIVGVVIVRRRHAASSSDIESSATQSSLTSAPTEPVASEEGLAQIHQQQ